MSNYTQLREQLRESPRRWLVTGAAGFIGSNLLETLLRLGQEVTGLDNFSRGLKANLASVRASVGEDLWKKCRFVEGDIRDAQTCLDVCAGVDSVLHQAALGSVPRSIEDPIGFTESNIAGFVNMLTAAKDAGVGNFVYASSSSIYGDDPGLPKVEDRIGKPLSPYALTKATNEQFAAVYERAYGFRSIGLRYFNVFGRRQDPKGAYAAVVPSWFASLLAGEDVYINGDGETSRDFCYIDNTVQANLLAGTTGDEDAQGRVYNVAYGQRTTLTELYEMIRAEVATIAPEVAGKAPVYRDFRPGDVRHSLADTSLIAKHLGYAPTHDVTTGLSEAAAWYLENLSGSGKPGSV